MAKYDIGKLVKRKNTKRVAYAQVGIVLNERLKETFDENGYGGCYVPQVLVAWGDLKTQQWVARKLLTFSYEDKNDTIKFT